MMMNKERGTPTPGRQGWGGDARIRWRKGGDARISTRLRFFPGCQTI